MALVYLDHNATTPLDPRVREAMLPWLGESFGNPSSLHRRGRAARAAVDEARARVARLIGGRPEEIVFAASGTEANNAVVASAGSRAGRRGRLVISSLEHPSIRVAAERLEASGMEVVRVPPGPDGVVPAARFLAALTPDTRLACLMVANNEVGTLQPVAEVARACRELGVPLLADAVQAAGKVPVDAAALEADYLVLGAHKLHGPLGAAALWVRPGAALEPFLTGGGQERRLRAGTENVPALVGFGEAARLAAEELAERAGRLAALRDRLEAVVRERIPGACCHCTEAPRLPQTSHLAFPGVEGEALLLRLDAAGYAVSTGAACSSGRPEPSKTLLAMGISPEEALASIRVSLGAPTTAAEVEGFVGALEREVGALRRVMKVPAQG
ncbi:MAG TPA: cysteine desulfurase family protein [Thermoanaerobaculia bacterium]|nr:cysteine desulfurase family protein [Thermoanaerobaculia bacterium]